MKNFLIKLSLFLLLSAGFVYWASTLAGGYTDNFYIKFTSPAQSSLIIGTSRAAQGLLPDEINRTLHRKDMFNYAFTWENSPYGKTYLENIKRKLKSNEKNGIFIMAIDPWCITCKNTEQNSHNDFQESHLVLSTPFVNLNPNIPYLIKFCDNKYKFLTNEKTHMFLHNDGWLELNIPMDDVSVQKRTNKKTTKYKSYIDIVSFSKVRFHYFIETIKFLKNHGKVFLVRMPVTKAIGEIEQQFMPNFDLKMDSLSRQLDVPYLNYTHESEKYNYTDGNHIYKESGKVLSRDIALKIKNYLKP